MNLPFFTLLKIFLQGKSGKLFFVAALFSFSFSIAVILGTLGLMDGFESTLMDSLKKSSGDFILSKNSSFFYREPELDTVFTKQDVIASYLLQVESFASNQDAAIGVVVSGVDPNTFNQVTGLELDLDTDKLAIGKVLAKRLDLRVGDSLKLAFASNSSFNQGAPILQRLKVSQIIDHGIYEKNLRLIFINESSLRDILRVKEDYYNRAYLKSLKLLESNQDYRRKARSLNDFLPAFQVSTFWEEFTILIKAIKIEKYTIAIILQLIVIISVFNVISFITFISEKKSQDLFLLKALGATNKSLIRFWSIFIISLWASSCGLSLFYLDGFQWMLHNMSIFELPGDIYILSELNLIFDIGDYFVVFGSSFVWISLISILSLIKLRKLSVIAGLRKEFS